MESHCFQIARSEVLDAFARLEIAVLTLLTECKTACNPTACLGQKLVILGKIPPGPKLSRKRKGEIDEARARAELLLPVRADVVHSQLEVLPGEPQRALYQNPAGLGLPYASARVMSLEAHKQLAKDALEIATLLSTPA